MMEGKYSYELKNSTWGQKPVNGMSFWNAVRFANWLTTGGTEDGVYTLNNVTNPEIRSITGNTDVSGFAIPAENEWYKAAYYKGGESNEYWLFTEQSDSQPNGNDTHSPTDVGTYGSRSSHCGTHDQGCNVWEWTEELLSIDEQDNYYRKLRGSSIYFNGNNSRSDVRLPYYRYNPGGTHGFPIVSITAIPEP